MMPRSRTATILRASERLYAFLFFVYPPAYRREYGPLMIQIYRDLCRDGYRQRGMAGIVPLWVSSIDGSGRKRSRAEPGSSAS